jgi:hypothetical protein
MEVINMYKILIKQTLVLVLGLGLYMGFGLVVLGETAQTKTLVEQVFLK